MELVVVVMIREVHPIDAPVRHHETPSPSLAVARRLGLLLDGWLC